MVLYLKLDKTRVHKGMYFNDIMQGSGGGGVVG